MLDAPAEINYFLITIDIVVYQCHFVSVADHRQASFPPDDWRFPM